MKRFRICISVVCIAFLSACGKEKKSTENHIPADATMVIVANTKKIMTELAAGGVGIADTKPYTQYIEDSSFAALKSFWQYQDSLSIDYEQPIVSTILPLQNSEEKVPFWATVIPIKNRDSFIGGITRNFKLEFKKENDNYFWPIGSEGVLGVGKNYAVAVMKTKNSLVTLPETRSVFEYSISGDNFKDQIDALLNLKKSKSIVTNKHYKKFELGTNDCKVWMNTEYWIVNNTVDRKALINLRLFGVEVFKESSVTMLQNFGKGTLNTKMYLHVKDDVTQMLSKTKPKNVDPTLLHYLTGNKLYGAVGFAMAPEMLKDYAAHLGQADVMKWALKSANINDSDIYNAITGDAISCVYGDSTQTQLSNLFNNVTLLKLKDSSKMAKLLQLPQLQSVMKAMGNNIYELGNEEDPIKDYIGYNDKILVMANSKEALLAILASKGDGTLANQAGQLAKGVPMTGFFNAAKTIQQVKKISAMGGLMSVVNVYLEMLANIESTEMKFEHVKDGIIAAELNMKLSNTSVNSLAYFIKAMAISKKKSEAIERDAFGMTISEFEKMNKE